MKRTPGDTPEEREQYWTKVIKEARAYSAGVVAYCTDKNFSKSNYYFWFRQLRSAHPEWHDLVRNPAQPGRQKQSNSGSNAQPEMEVAEKPRRRKFKASYKAKILQEADAAPPG